MHIFAYLMAHTNYELVFDPGEFLKKSEFTRQHWNCSIYHFDESELREVLPPGMYKNDGKGINMRVYIDIINARDYVTRCSRSGLVVLLNNAPIYCIPKKKNCAIPVCTLVSWLKQIKPLLQAYNDGNCGQVSDISVW